MAKKIGNPVNPYVAPNPAHFVNFGPLLVYILTWIFQFTDLPNGSCMPSGDLPQYHSIFACRYGCVYSGQRLDLISQILAIPHAQQSGEVGNGDDLPLSMLSLWFISQQFACHSDRQKYENTIIQFLYETLTSHPQGPDRTNLDIDLKFSIMDFAYSNLTLII